MVRQPLIQHPGPNWGQSDSERRQARSISSRIRPAQTLPAVGGAVGRLPVGSQVTLSRQAMFNGMSSNTTTLSTRQSNLCSSASFTTAIPAHPVANVCVQWLQVSRIRER